MAVIAKPAHVAARSGAEYLAAVGADERELWLDGERVGRPLEHPKLRAAAESIARVYDLQLEHAGDVVAPSPEDGRLVNVTHLVPRSQADLERRRRAFELVAGLSGGVMGRTPDYLNVTFACFAGRADVWARRGASEQADNLVRYQAHLRDADLSCTHAIMNPQVDRTKPEADQAAGRVALHKVGETADAIVVRGARMLATLAPFADELAVYPGSDIRPQDGRYALAFGLGHLMAETTGVARFDHIQEKLGQIWNMLELTRSALVAAEAGSALDDGGVWYPDERPFLALRGELPRWMPRVNELLQLIGGGGFMATPSWRDLHGEVAGDIAEYFQAAGADAERRVRLFRLAWDFLGSDLGGRSELYERFHLSDSFRMTGLAYRMADKSLPLSLVERFLQEPVE